MIARRRSSGDLVAIGRELGKAFRGPEREKATGIVR